MIRVFIVFSILITLLAGSSCRSKVEPNGNLGTSTAAMPPPTLLPTVSSTPSAPNLQSELLDDRDKTTSSPVGSFDFKNYTYELPRGWQNPDGSTAITLVNGRIAPIEGKVHEEMSDEQRAEEKAHRRIGLSYVTTKYMDVTGDGDDEAVVILKIETAGSAIPQLVYVYTWKDGKPELLWPFRTGDRADGGLKDIRSEGGELVAELYGQDRFLLGQMETGKIGDDLEQLCCPTYFSRSRYKWNGKNFLMQGKRLTFSIADPSAHPVENMGEKTEGRQKSKK